MIVRKSGSACITLALFGIASFGVTMPVRATITGVTVVSSHDTGPFRGKGYSEARATLAGTAPGGTYAVPVTVIQPKEAADGNGVAVVEVLNTVVVGQDSVLGPEPLPLARLHIGDDYLFGTGHAYVGVLWDKNAVESLGTGSIAQPGDGYTILTDAAQLARTPASYLNPSAASPSAPLKVVAFGFSQTGAVLRDFFLTHHNSAGGSTVFDAAIVGGAGGACFRVSTLSWDGCEGPLDDGGKVIAISAEGDAQFAGGWERARMRIIATSR